MRREERTGWTSKGQLTGSVADFNKVCLLYTSYEDSVTGRISDERFTELSADYEAEQRELKERAEIGRAHV